MSIIFKAFGALFIIFYCTALGIKKGVKFTTRYEILNEITLYLSTIKYNIIYKKDTKQYIINSANLNSQIKYIKLKLSECESYEFQNELSKALNIFKIDNSNYLSQDELLSFCELLNNLGSSNSFEEEQKINYTIEEFKNKAKYEHNKAKEQSKLYKTLGFCAGVAIALMLL